MSCKNVLIVEDEKAIRDMMKDILEHEGYNVYMASDGTEGITYLRNISPQACVVILDLMMPGTNGWQFLDFQREDPALAEIPIILCSAYRESAKSVKANMVVEKPIKLEALLDAVQTFCA